MFSENETFDVKNQKRLILIVDDLKDVRDLYGHFLRQRGFRVAWANDGHEAFDSALRLQPDLIIMDLSMPRMRGGEATRRLKAEEKTKHIPVVVLTAYASDDMAQTALAAGFDGFLTKPCWPDALLAEINRQLERKDAKDSAADTSSAATQLQPANAASQLSAPGNGAESPVEEKKGFLLLAVEPKADRDAYENSLSLKGFRVVSASDDQQALGKAFELLPDLAIVDLALPVTGGWTVVRRLKAAEATRHIPILVLTTHKLDGAAAAAGCEGFLLKPCSPDDIVAEITRVLERRVQA